MPGVGGYYIGRLSSAGLDLGEAAVVFNHIAVVSIFNN